MNKANNTKRKKLVVGNWKMNGSLQTNAELLQTIFLKLPKESKADIVICPPFPYLQQVAELTQGSLVSIGAQTVSERTPGACTGETSVQMLKEFGCRYAIIGHNERRRMQRETDVEIADKFQHLLDSGLTPILCVGESLDQRESGQALAVIEDQLNHVIDQVGIDAFMGAVVAYEPVWAVGTGKTATPEQAQEVHAFIRSKFEHIGSHMPILYGGSVKASNAEQLFAMPDIDGALLGGASLDADEFCAIIFAINLS